MQHPAAPNPGGGRLPPHHLRGGHRPPQHPLRGWREEAGEGAVHLLLHEGEGEGGLVAPWRRPLPLERAGRGVAVAAGHVVVEPRGTHHSPLAGASRAGASPTTDSPVTRWSPVSPLRAPPPESDSGPAAWLQPRKVAVTRRQPLQRHTFHRWVDARAVPATRPTLRSDCAVSPGPRAPAPRHQPGDPQHRCYGR